MTQLRPVYTDDAGALALAALIGDAAGSSGGQTRSAPATFGTPVIVAEPTEFPSADPDGTVNNRTLQQIDGDEWADSGQPMPVRRISAGRQIAVPCGRHGLCVQDATFWAVNVGTLAAATHPLTGHSEGVAAVLGVKTDGDLEITDGRLPFVNRDGNAVSDGTLIQLQYCSGTLTIVWAACEAHAALEGLEVAP